MDYDARRLFERLGGVSSPKMEGDNLAILLCGYFDNPDQEDDDENGWTLDAVTGCDEVLDAIRAHFQPLADAIADLRARNDELIEMCAQVVDNHRPDASFDDSGSGAMERNALLDNVAAEIRTLTTNREE